MRESINFTEKQVTNGKMETDEKEHAKKYVGKYVLKTMDYGPTKEAQFKAVKLDPNNPEKTEIDTWKFRFHSLINSIEEAPRFKRRSHQSWEGRTRVMLEKFIYSAPNEVGEALMEISDKVNGFQEDEIKNSKGRLEEPSTQKSPQALQI